MLILIHVPGESNYSHSTESNMGNILNGIEYLDSEDTNNIVNGIGGGDETVGGSDTVPEDIGGIDRLDGLVWLWEAAQGSINTSDRGLTLANGTFTRAGTAYYW